MTRGLASAALLLTIGACATPDPATASVTAAITDGVTDSGHAPVGLILIGASGGKAKSICTGTIVGTKTVLTATHCLEVGENTLFQHDGNLYTVVKMIRRSDWDPSTSKYRKDIGLAVLDKAIPNAPTYPLASAAPTQGANVTLVGFGITADGLKDAGTKRKADNTIAAVQGDYFTIKNSGSGVGNACQGDSGGPVLATVGGKTQVVGVISASDAPCGSKSYHVRVDAFRSWLLQQAAGDIGGGAADSEKPTISIDEPQDGATVAATLTLKVSASDNVGVASVKVEVDGASRGEQSTPPYAFPLSLTPGAHTLKATATDAAGNSASASVQVTVAGAADDGGVAADSALVPDAAGPGAFGDPCGPARPCADGLLCRADAEGSQYCTQTCVVGYASCPEGSECVGRSGEEICTRPEQKPSEVGGDGCALGSSSTSGDAELALVLLALGLLVSRRRRR